MSKQYHSLLVRDNRNSPWCIHFGDYDRSVVSQERQDITDNEYKFSDTKVITTKEDQASINEAIQELNS